jgi:alpha-N-arabinofuranosidase
LSKIVIDLDKKSSPISPFIYGHFIEHLGGCVYDGIWVGENSKIPNICGIRQDTVEYLQRIQPPVVRWPGGCFADCYHWQDGIGPRDKRPRRYGRWNDATEPNQFGTHEFMNFCRLIGSEPYLTANVGTGSPQEFHYWMEYCNAPINSTTLADQRAENGSPEPFGVKFWEIGNETWGFGGTNTAEGYADTYRRFVTMMPGYDVPLFTIPSGPYDDDRDWTRRFFEQNQRAKPTTIGGWSVHYYFESGTDSLNFTLKDWYSMLHQAKHLEEVIEGQWGVLSEFDPDRRIKLIINEWGAQHLPGSEASPKHLYGQVPTMRDAVIDAFSLDIINRHADKVHMANICLLTNALQGLFLTDGDKFVATPVFYIYELYAVHQNAQGLDVDISSPQVENLPALAGSASVKGNTIALTVTNLHATENMEAEICLRGANIREARLTTLSHEDIRANNTFSHPFEVIPKVSSLTANTDALIVRFEPASVNRIDIEIG